MRIWIDLTNSPHVLVMRPVIERLRSDGHDVRVTARDARWEQTVQLADGEKKTLRVSIALEQRAPPVTTQKLVGYVMGGAGMVSMAVGGFFGAKALGDSHDLDAVCGTGANARKFCPASTPARSATVRSR